MATYTIGTAAVGIGMSVRVPGRITAVGGRIAEKRCGRLSCVGEYPGHRYCRRSLASGIVSITSLSILCIQEIGRIGIDEIGMSA